MPNRAQQIRDRLDEIAARLGERDGRAWRGARDDAGFFDGLLKSPKEDEIAALVEERRQLQREYDQLPPRLREADDA